MAATAVDGMHPTGMHSCYMLTIPSFYQKKPYFQRIKLDGILGGYGLHILQPP